MITSSLINSYFLMPISCGRAGQYLSVVQFNGYSNILNYLYSKVLTYQAVVERCTGDPLGGLLSYKPQTLK